MNYDLKRLTATQAITYLSDIVPKSQRNVYFTIWLNKQDQWRIINRKHYVNLNKIWIYEYLNFMYTGELLIIEKEYYSKN